MKRSLNQTCSIALNEIGTSSTKENNFLPLHFKEESIPNQHVHLWILLLKTTVLEAPNALMCYKHVFIVSEKKKKKTDF